MNQNDISEIKRNFKTDSPWLTLNTVLTAYVKVTGIEKEILYKKVRPFEEFSQEEGDLHLGMLKKVVAGKLGKTLRPYKFTTDEKGEQTRKLFYDLRTKRLLDEDAINSFLEHIVENSGYDESFYVTCVFCDYLIPAKNKNQDVIEGEGSRFPFMVCVFNKVSLTQIGLVYDDAAKEIVKKTNVDMQVLNNVMDGFMYPGLQDGAADISRILYYTPRPKNMNVMMADQMLSAQYELSSNEEEDTFHALVENMYDNKISFQNVSNLQENLYSMLKDHPQEADELVLDKEDLRALMENAGADEKTMTKFDSAALKTIQDQSIYAANAMNADKISINAGGIKISAKADEKDRIKTRLVDGRYCLLIELNGQMEYNGFEVSPGSQKINE